MFYLVCPKRRNLLTGGYIYNRAVATALEHRLPLRYLLLPDEQVAQRIRRLAERGKPIILDSLLIADPRILSLLTVPRPGDAGPRLFLAHFLPSLDPLLPASETAALRRTERRVLACVDGAVAPSRFLAGELAERGLPAESIAVCRPGVDRDLFAAVPHGRPNAGHDGRTARLLTVANWTEAKGHLFLLDVLLELGDLPWTWDIVGDTSAEPSVYDRFRGRLGGSPLRQRVRIHGTLTPGDTGRLLAGADLLVSASIMESYGMVFAESMAAGVPVVGNRVGGIPEVVEHGVTGFLCTPGDRDGWRALLSMLIASPERRAEVRGRILQRRSQLPAWEQTADCVYRRLASLMDTLRP